MSVVSRRLGNTIIYPQRRVYTAPEQRNYSGLEYLDPNNLNYKRYEDEVPPDFALAAVLKEVNPYDPIRRPSDNLTIHHTGLPPLQCNTYDMLDNRYGASVFNAPIPEVHPKLRTKADMAHASYIQNLTKEQISFSEEYASSGRDGNLNDPQFISRLIRDHRPPVMIKNSVINEPVGQTFRDAFNPSKTHRRVNASALAPQDMGQEEIRLFARTGRWC